MKTTGIGSLIAAGLLLTSCTSQHVSSPQARVPIKPQTITTPTASPAPQAFAGSTPDGSAFQAVIERTATGRGLRSIGYELAGTGLSVEQISSSRGFLVEWGGAASETTIPIIIDIPNLMIWEPIGKWPPDALRDSVRWYSLSIEVVSPMKIICRLTKTAAPETEQVNRFDMYKATPSQMVIYTNVEGKGVVRTSGPTIVEPKQSYVFEMSPK